VTAARPPGLRMNKDDATKSGVVFTADEIELDQ
jgi:hypothetical protein